MEVTQILEEKKPRDMIDPLQMKDPNWMLKEKIKYEAIGTSGENSVGDKDVLLSMCHALCSRKIPRVSFTEQIRNLKRITRSTISI